VWRKGLPQCFVPDLNVVSFVSEARLSQVVLLNIAYHQCMCVLHSSIVPLMSLGPTLQDFGYSQVLSAQIALRHARHISDIFHGSHRWKPSVAPGFVGYAAYSSIAIQLPFLWCQKSGVKELTLSNIRTNSRIMTVISRHWRIVLCLVRRHHQGARAIVIRC
jgi:hypothetical protein